MLIRVHRVFAVFFLAFLVVACGQMGPLYLPQDRPPEEKAAQGNLPTDSAPASEQSTTIDSTSPQP